MVDEDGLNIVVLDSTVQNLMDYNQYYQIDVRICCLQFENKSKASDTKGR